MRHSAAVAGWGFWYPRASAITPFHNHNLEFVRLWQRQDTRAAGQELEPVLRHVVPSALVLQPQQLPPSSDWATLKPSPSRVACLSSIYTLVPAWSTILQALGLSSYRFQKSVPGGARGARGALNRILPHHIEPAYLRCRGDGSR